MRRDACAEFDTRRIQAGDEGVVRPDARFVIQGFARLLAGKGDGLRCLVARNLLDLSVVNHTQKFVIADLFYLVLEQPGKHKRVEQQERYHRENGIVINWFFRWRMLFHLVFYLHFLILLRSGREQSITTL
ncbi:hypothetical protein SDC9_128181 [bioreactor metagenome]|uniref:Uncharacterized protein n=1 Tax=bioreactor metagenome TaxID=1076179 RepID=A0A645CW42_9ZZZZ